MIQKIILKNFKLFKEETEVPLSNINLLTGINGRGKSTVLQSLLLMKQSLEYNRTTNKINFNGDDVKLGSYTDVKNINTQTIEGIEISFNYEKFLIRYKLSQNPNDPMVADIEAINVEISLDDNESKFQLVKSDDLYTVIKNSEDERENFPTFLYDLFISDIALTQYYENYDCEEVKKVLNFSRIHYVSADRIGPKLFYSEKSLKDFYSVGALGEETINVLYHSKDQQLEKTFIENIDRFFHVVTDDLGTTVDWQTEFWLNKIFNGAKYKINRVEEANLLTFLISPDGNSNNYYKPTNVGYGYSYVLPIIVAGLIARPGEILIVENPEAHLHPYAQSIIAKFLTLVSLTGVQVIIESHSEHILNGLRIPIYDGIIDKNHLNVLYFDRDLDTYFKKIEVDDRGGIDNWPKDFFDQATNDLNHLFGI